MNITNLRNEVTNLRSQLDDARNQARALAADSTATAQALNDQADTIARLNAQLRIAEDALHTEEARQAGNVQPQQAAPERLTDMLSSNEYRRAFAYAIRNGLNPRTAGRHEEAKILLDALTETGNSGADGGFLVPIDVDNEIRELKRALNPLADLFDRESVTALSGWRVKDTAPTTGMSSVEEMATVPSNDQPAFAKVEYTLTKYGLIVPVSNELAADEDANLFGYLARWFAKKDVITENLLLLSALSSLVATDIAAGSELAGVKTALNVALDPEIALNASIVCNQDAFNLLDTLTDGTGRALIHIDPTTATPRMVNGKTIHVVSNSVLPTATGKAPIYIGDFTQYATLFQRNPMEIVSTDIGGTAFTTDSIQVRGIHRMCVSKFDTEAVVKRTLAIA